MDVLDRDSLIKVLSYVSCRDVLALACTCRELSAMLRDDAIWRELAELKWGSAVRQLASVPAGQWASWVKHRLSATCAPLSPLGLIQEHYQHDAFQHLVACVLCSRTTGGPVVRDAIHLFLALHPNPTAVLSARDDSLLDVMRPLGLPASRLAGVRSIAHDFLAADWQDPSEFKQCGKFVSDSWRIFCRGHRGLKDVEDKNLRVYLRWRLTGAAHDEEAEQKRRQAAAARAKRRREEKAAEAGTLRSGRRRVGSGDAASASSVRKAGRAGPAGERHQTRAAAAAAAAVGPADKGRGGGAKRASAANHRRQRS